MPVMTTRIEIGIYHNNWVDVVTIEEVAAATGELNRLIAEDNVERFMVIICTANTTRFPLSLTGLRSTIPKGIIEGVVYGVPRIGELILRTFLPISKVHFELCKTKEEALAYARTTLAGFNAAT